MMKLTPAPNVIFGFMGGMLAFALLRAAAHFGYTPGDDIVEGLPMALAIALAHLWDVLTGENKSVQEVLEERAQKKNSVKNRPF